MPERSILQRLLSGLALPLAVAGTVAAAGPQPDDEQHATRIHVEHHGESDAEGAQVLFVGDGGEVVEIEGEGPGLVWDDDGEGRHYRLLGPHGALGEGAFLGVSTTPLTPELRQHFGAPAEAGVMISQVVDDSAAFRAGLLVGDIVTALDGEAVASPFDLLRAIRDGEEGASVTLDVVRDRQVQSVSAVLGKSESAMRTLGFGDGHHRPHGFPGLFRVHCEEDGGDCDIFLGRRLERCAGDADCNVDISCDAGECTCKVDGEATDCETLHRHPEREGG